MDKKPGYIIVVGTSAGGLSALTELVAQLDTDIDAAVFIIFHLPKSGVINTFIRKIQSFTPLQCLVAEDGAQIERGKIYIAPHDYHLLLKSGVMKLTNGPRENRWRPSIDVLFRTAAVAYTGSVIGIILTGLLDDGNSGMKAIKECGGITMVQDPEDAQFPDMPLAVLSSITVDYCVPVSQMGFVLYEVIRNKEPQSRKVPYQIQKEAEIAEKSITDINTIGTLGNKSLYACPDCGGGLWELEESNGDIRYRCHIGHSYTKETFLINQGSEIESTLWVALRMMEERYNMLQRSGEDERSRGIKLLADTHLQRAEEIRVHINKLKDILFSNKNEWAAGDTLAENSDQKN